MNTELARFLTMNFISSLIISYVMCFILIKFGLYDVLYIGNLFGLYFLVIYGVNVLVEEKFVSNNKNRFLIAIAYILIFDLIFIATMPILFGFDMFQTQNIINLVFKGVEYNLGLTPIFYLFVFVIVILIYNFVLYRAKKN